MCTRGKYQQETAVVSVAHTVVSLTIQSDPHCLNRFYRKG